MKEKNSQGGRKMKLKYVCMSNIGKLRRTNQDNFVVPNHECADTLHDTTEMIFGETEDNGAAFGMLSFNILLFFLLYAAGKSGNLFCNFKDFSVC